MLRRGRELWLSLLAIILISMLYIGVAVRQGSIPAAREFFGHSLGVLGFSMMIATETLYSIRKRVQRANWGRMSRWLEVHIFTGLVGPYMVLLHSSWKFNGLAGVVTFLTLVVVASGVVGRYIYTAVPRTADGAVVQTEQIQAQIASAEVALAQWAAIHPESSDQVKQAITHPARGKESGLILVLGRGVVEIYEKAQAWNATRRLNRAARGQAVELSKLLRRRRTLQRQINSLAVSRRLLAIWHAIHIPLGMAMFVSAVVHISGAIYYASFLR